MKKQNQKKKIEKKDLLPVALVIIICCLVIVLTTSYAFFSYQRSGKSPSTVKTGNLNVLLDDHDSPGITQIGAYPVYDEVGRNSEPHTFVLKNLGTVEVNYKLKLVEDQEGIIEDGCQNNQLDKNSIKVQLIKNGKVIYEDLMSNIKDNVLDEGFLGLTENVNKHYSYELRFWIDANAGAETMGKHYHGRLEVEIIDPLNS